MPKIAKYKQYYYLITGFFLLFGTTLCFSQIDFSFKYNNTEGFPSTEAYDIATDKQGFLWISSDKGLTRYNGKTFEYFNIKQGLPSNIVGKIVISSKGRVYIICDYTENKIFYIKDNHIYPYQYKYNDKITPPILNLEFDLNDDIIGVITSRNYFKKINGRFTKISSKLNYNTVEYTDNSKLVYLSKVDSKSSYFYFKDKKIKANYTSELDYRINYRVNRSFCAYNQKEIVTIFDRLYIIDPATKKIEKEIVCPDLIINFFIDKQGNNWLIMSNGGYIVLDHEKFAKDYTVPEIENKNLKITSINQDYAGGYWLGTQNQGLINLKSNNIKNIDFGKEFDDHQLTTVLQLRDNKLAIEFSDLDIYILDLKLGTQNIKKIHPNKPIGKDNPIVNNYLYSLNYNSKFDEIYFTTIIKAHTYNVNSNIRKEIIEEGELYNTRFRLSMGNPSQIELYKKIALKLKEDELTFANYSYFDGDDVWILCENTLYKYAIKTDKIIKFELGSKPTSVLKLKNKRFIVSTLGKGVFEYINNKFYRLKLGLNINDDMINKMVAYENIVVAGTLNGLLKMDFNAKKISAIPIDKRTGYNINGVESLASQGKNVYFSNNNKLGYFDIEKIPEPISKPNVFIDSILINGKKQTLTNDISISEGDELDFYINSVNYSGPSGVEYYYSNTNASSPPSWKRLGGNRLSVSDINEDDYKVLFKVTNGAGKDSKIISVDYNVSVSFFKSKIFYFLIALIILSGVVYYMLNQIKSIKEKNELREEALYYEVQALGAQMSPHFIFNVITNIQSFILAENKLKAFSYLNDFAKLMRISLDHIKEKWINLKSETQLMSIFLKLENLRNENFDYEIEIDPELSLENTYIPPLLIQPFVENAIKHGVFHLKDRKGLIKIKLEKYNDQIQCVVSDNGYGREKAKTFTPTTSHKSHAQSITVKRLELIMKYTNQKFDFQIIDLPNEMGTQIKYNIPYKIS